jgi:prenyltransferase beta subunit
MSPIASTQKPSFSVIDQYQTNDGGACQQVSDLWCTYAATRALTWLSESPSDKHSCAEYMLECQNNDGGFAWQKGMRSDVWATYYCTQVLMDLGYSIASLPQLAEWLQKLVTPEGGFSMTPGQPADIWATYYTVRTFHEVLRQEPPMANRVRQWLAATQQSTGGLGWSAAECPADTRACYYGAISWQCLGSAWPEGGEWNREALVAWLRDRQTEEGGFVFDETQKQPCLWATFRATRALAALGSEPRDKAKCIDWILSRKLPGSGFSRWDSYLVADVWACFCAVGALDALKILETALKEQSRAEVVKFLQSCQLPNAGFTYREPENAGDSLATSALCILKALAGNKGIDADKEQIARFAWLRRAHMPYEGGVMYMPGRGAEVRCTLWSLAALNFVGEPPLDRTRLYRWFTELQNPDGGFGYWHGRGSDLVATVSALESLQYLGLKGDRQVNLAASGQFLLQCEDPMGMKFVPDGEVTLSTTCQGIRGLLAVGLEEKARELATLIPKYASKLGGYAAKLSGALPDLLSTYQAVLTLQALKSDWDINGLSRFLSKVRQPAGGYAWSPLSRSQAGPLATCLGELLQQAVEAKQSGTAFTLPKLNL